MLSYYPSSYKKLFLILKLTWPVSNAYFSYIRLLFPSLIGVAYRLNFY